MNKWQQNYEAPARWESSFTPKPKNQEDYVRTQYSIHPYSKATAKNRRARALERWENATPKERVGMFKPNN